MRALRCTCSQEYRSHSDTTPSSSVLYCAVYCYDAGANARKAVNEKRADFTPLFFHAAPRMYREGKIPMDVAFLHVSPPDTHGMYVYMCHVTTGYVTLGLSVGDALGALDSAKLVIAQVNPMVPRIFGNTELHVSKIHKMCWCDDHLPLLPPAPTSEIDAKVAANVAALIPDGACLQVLMLCVAMTTGWHWRSS